VQVVVCVPMPAYHREALKVLIIKAALRMLEMVCGAIDSFIQKCRFRHLGDLARRAIVGGIWNLIAHKQLLTNNTDAFTPIRRRTLKPSYEFARAIERIIIVRIIEAKVYFHHLNPFDLIKAIANRYGFPRKYGMLFVLLRR